MTDKPPEDENQTDAITAAGDEMIERLIGFYAELKGLLASGGGIVHLPCECLCSAAGAKFEGSRHLLPAVFAP